MSQTTTSTTAAARDDDRQDRPFMVLGRVLKAVGFLLCVCLQPAGLVLLAGGSVLCWLEGGEDD